MDPIKENPNIIPAKGWSGRTISGLEARLAELEKDKQAGIAVSESEIQAAEARLARLRGKPSLHSDSETGLKEDEDFGHINEELFEGMSLDEKKKELDRRMSGINILMAQSRNTTLELENKERENIIAQRNNNALFDVGVSLNDVGDVARKLNLEMQQIQYKLDQEKIILDKLEASKRNIAEILNAKNKA